MLASYAELFFMLEQENCVYCIYKGLNHLDDDLKGARGDIDILVSENSLQKFDSILINCGFKRDLSRTKFPNYYFKRDEQTGRMLMVDLDCKVRLGNKPLKPFVVQPNWTKMKLLKRNISEVVITILDPYDYLPLTLLIRLTARQSPEFDMNEISELYNQLDRVKLADSFYSKLLLKLSYNKTTNIYDDIHNLNSWNDLQGRYKNLILESLEGSRFSLNIRLFGNVVSTWFAVQKPRLKRLLQRPNYRLYRGAIICMIGVDGAGKSTSIEAVLNDTFYKTAGVKRIYFGNNEYWFPCLNFFDRTLKNLRILWIVIPIIKSFDRQMRSVWALYLSVMGNIVLCDRYYYDDECGKIIAEKKMTNLKPFTKFKRKFVLQLKPRMFIKPDLTLFFNVSPEVAFKRKQDFSYEVMLEVNQCYREVMKNRQEVVNIDADQKHSKVIDEVFSHINSIIHRIG